MDLQKLEGVVPRLLESEMSGFLGHLWLSEMPAGARALDPWEACHLLTLVTALPESHRASWNLSEGLPLKVRLCGVWGPGCFHPTRSSV